jgi:hypothetical protein
VLPQLIDAEVVIEPSLLMFRICVEMGPQVPPACSAKVSM